MSLNRKERLSRLIIDCDKDWENHSVENFEEVKVGDGADDGYLKVPKGADRYR